MKHKLKELQYIGTWEQPVLPGSFWHYWYDNINPILFEIEPLDGKFYLIDGKHHVVKKDIIKIKRFLNSNWNNKTLLKIFETWLENTHNEIITLIRKKELMQKKLNNLKISMIKITSPWIFFILLDKALEELLSEKKISIKEEIRPLKESFYVRQMKEVRKIFESIDSQFLTPKLMREINQHIKKYSFLGISHFIGNNYSFKDFIRSLNLIEDNLNQDKTNNSLGDKRKNNQSRQWYEDLISISAWGRLLMAETSSIIQSETKNVLQDYNNQLKYNKDDYLWLTIDEITSFNKIDLNEIKERKKGYGLLNEEIITGKELTEIKNSLKKINHNKKRTGGIFYGHIASKSKGREIIKGRVKIITKLSDLHKFRRNDILVSYETSPELMPVLRKAKAIITEHGGLTSHAAIIGRELRLPVLIGVKDFIEYIKDGDEIEINMRTGKIKLVD